MVEDTGKRLDSLYQRMDADQIPQHILAMAVQLATGKRRPSPPALLPLLMLVYSIKQQRLHDSKHSRDVAHDYQF